MSFATFGMNVSLAGNTYPSHAHARGLQTLTLTFFVLYGGNLSRKMISLSAPASLEALIEVPYQASILCYRSVCSSSLLPVCLKQRTHARLRSYTRHKCTSRSAAAVFTNSDPSICHIASSLSPLQSPLYLGKLGSQQNFLQRGGGGKN